MAGRPRREEQVAVMTLRIPHPLLERVNRCKALVELQEGANLSRTEVLWVIIEEGCRVLEGQVTPSGQAPGVLPEIFLPDTLEPSGRPLEGPGRHMEGQPGSPVRATVRTRLRTSQRSLPAHIARIAEERAKFQYSRLSLADFAQHLFDTGIYRARDRHTGAEKPVNRGTLLKWLERADQSGIA